MPEDKSVIDYRHHGVGLLRATAESIDLGRWPDPNDARDCRGWLAEAWALPGIAPAVRHASPVLAHRVQAVLGGEAVAARTVQRVALAVVRYVLRAAGRATPFGTFAGVGPLRIATSTCVRWGTAHRPVAGVEGRWLHQVVLRLETCPELLARLQVVVNDAAQLRAGRWELPGPSTVSIRAGDAVALVRNEAVALVGFAALAGALARTFPGAGDPSAMLTSLVRHGFLLTSLRAPSTVTDPLGYLVERLRAVDALALPVAALAGALDQIHKAIAAHNDAPSEEARTELAVRMRALEDSVRMPLSVDLRVDAEVRLPRHVAWEMQRAAGVLARVAREPTGRREMREYFAAFVDRYGTGTLVPLRTMLDRDAGLGWPRGYPGTTPSARRHVFSARDELLLEMAATAAARGSGEIELGEASVDRLAVASAAGGLGAAIPPHVDLGARVHATDPDALDRGEFTLTVSPGRAAGTLSSRFTPLVPDAGLAKVFAALPTTTDGALSVQLSFAPIHPAAQNVSRVPAYLSDVVSVGEPAADGATGVEDLAVTATRHRLHLVSLSRRRVVEPQVLHALAPKQQPPMARLIGELTRALDVGWIGFDWGAADTLPRLPRVRYGRAILSPARWRLALSILPVDPAGWDAALAGWRTLWRCPARVALRDFDQLLPLDLAVPAHRAVLYRHLRRHTDATLTETPDPAADGWLSGHPHSVVLPLTSRRTPEPAVPVDELPVVARGHGQLPAVAGSSWLYAKVFVSAQRIDPLLVEEFPALLAAIGEHDWWFVRYPQAREGEEPDHLRLRVRVHTDVPEDTQRVLAAVTGWAARLRDGGAIRRLVFDTYFPELGRYRAMAAAEDVFSADSRLVLAQLTHLTGHVAATVLAGLSLFDTVTAFLDDRTAAAEWLRTRTRDAVTGRPGPGRDEVAAITRLARAGRQADIPGWPSVVADHIWRGHALARYRLALPADLDADAVLHSLLHMHHNRALGVDRDREAVCLRLARHAAAAWHTTGNPG